MEQGHVVTHDYPIRSDQTQGVSKWSQAIIELTAENEYQDCMSSEMNWRFALLLRILVNSVPALLLFGGIELSVRAAFWFRNAVAEVTPIVYVFGRDAGPHPPWRRSIIERDRLLSWRSHPNFKENWIRIFSPAQSAAAQRQLIQQFCPRIPDEVRVKPRDLVSLNAEGFRGENFREAKPEGIYRIISLGDSWTFGTSVGQYQTYPALLEAELNRLDLRKRYEVINLSVPGYSSYHGTLLMKRAVELNPDLLIIGYAMNEPDMAGYKSKSTMEQLWRSFVYFATEGLQSVNLARYWARLLSYREESPVVGLTKDALWHEKVATAVEQPAWLNESLREY